MLEKPLKRRHEGLIARVRAASARMSLPPSDGLPAGPGGAKRPPGNGDALSLSVECVVVGEGEGVTRVAPNPPGRR